MTGEEMQFLIDLLNQIGGPLWDALMKQTMIDGYAGLLWSFILILCVVAAVLGIYKSIDDGEFGATVLLVIVAAVSILILIAVAKDSFTCFYNPEYHALQLLLENIGR